MVLRWQHLKKNYIFEKTTLFMLVLKKEHGVKATAVGF
jgi:hypothetical protein